MTTLKENNLIFLLKKTLADIVKGEVDTDRAELLERLLGQYDETGTKSFTVQIPGAEKVATLTLAEPKPTTKVDAAALLEWCRENRPDLLKTVHHPAQEAWDETVLADGAAVTITKEAKLAGTVYITDDGEPIDGLEYVPAGRPKSFTVRYEKGGQDRVIEAWKDGELGALDTGKNLPQITQ
ncbi:hypothetical protein [Sinomonas susongensis]|uniref:hypothetical protein n=1 Tax=Sinomonas susongensis TaxID=1324851 RepID=UPI001109D891|nr:hypothetical protein [Sinomonas susongensis]